MAQEHVNELPEISDFEANVVVVVTWKNMTAYPATMYAGKQVIKCSIDFVIKAEMDINNT